MSINRTPSLNDLITGKQAAKTLPENFFEQVVDLEIKLAKEYKMSTVQELTDLFKVLFLNSQLAIEYYESIEDPKFKDYTKRLNFLLTDPKLLKSINKKSSMPNIKSNTSNKDSYRRKSQNCAVKSSLNQEENEKTVNKFMKDAFGPTTSSNLINNDLSKQSNNFKLRLEEKRKNKNFSPLLVDDCETPIASNRSMNLFESDGKSQNNELIDSDIIINITGSPKGFGGDTRDTSSIKDFVNQFDISLEKKKSIGSISNENNLKNTKIVEQIKNKVNDFLSEFNNYFSKNIFNKYTNHIENLMNEKYKKHLEICNYYDNQIKEMEFLLVDCEELHKDSLYEIIKNLKSEEENALEKNDETYKIMMKESYSNFQTIGFKNNLYIKKFEEKFKIEIYHIVNSILKPNT